MSQMFFRGEVEQELRETVKNFTFKCDSDFETVMQCVEKSRVTDLYPHTQNGLCMEKG